MNFTRPVVLVRADLVFVGIRYKHLEYKAIKASPFLLRSPGGFPVVWRWLQASLIGPTKRNAMFVRSRTVREMNVSCTNFLLDIMVTINGK